MLLKRIFFAQLHFWEGFLSGLMTLITDSGGLALVILFLGYEFREYQVVRDKDYWTIIFFTMGYFLGLISGLYLFKVKGYLSNVVGK